MSDDTRPPFVLAVTRTETGSLELRISKPTDLLPLTRTEGLALWEHLGQLLAVPHANQTRRGRLLMAPWDVARAGRVLDALTREQLACLPGKKHRIVFVEGDVVPHCLHCEKLVAAEVGLVLERLGEHEISEAARQWCASHVTLREGSPGSGRYG